MTLLPNHYSLNIIVVWLCLFAITPLVFSEPAKANSQMAKKHGMSIFGNLAYKKDFKHFNYVNPQAPKGGEVTLGEVGTFDSVHPFILKGLVPRNLGLTFETLMTPAADEESSSYGLVARSVSIAKDKMSVTFYLRKEALFHDGTPIQAHDVAFTFNSLINEGNPYYRIYYQDVKDVEIINDQTIRFNFKHNNNRELAYILGQLPVLAEHSFNEQNPFSQTTLTPLISSGPYKIDSLEAGRWIKFKRVDDYWANDLPVNKGRFNFDTIHVDFYRDSHVAVEALKAGEYDFRRENISKVWAKSYQLDELKTGQMIKEELPDGTPTGMQCFVFNTRKAPFQDIKLREALNYAYDFEWTNEQLFYGAYSRNSSFFGNSKFAATTLPSKDELKLLTPFKDQLPKRVFNDIYTPPSTDGSGNARGNLLKAAHILNDAGWVLRDMKRINPYTDKPFTIEFLITSPVFERVIAPFIRNLKKLGIDASIRSVDPSQFVKRLQEYDYDIMVKWFTQSALPGNEQFDYWHSSRINVKGGKNYIGINNPVVDSLVERISTVTSEKELTTTLRALDRVLQWNWYVIPQWYSRTHRIIYWNKFGRPQTIAPYSLGFLDSWWIKENE